MLAVNDSADSGKASRKVEEAKNIEPEQPEAEVMLQSKEGLAFKRSLVLFEQGLISQSEVNEFYETFVAAEEKRMSGASKDGADQQSGGDADQEEFDIVLPPLPGKGDLGFGLVCSAIGVSVCAAAAAAWGPEVDADQYVRSAIILGGIVSGTAGAAAANKLPPGNTLRMVGIGAIDLCNVIFNAVGTKAAQSATAATKAALFRTAQRINIGLTSAGTAIKKTVDDTVISPVASIPSVVGEAVTTSVEKASKSLSTAAAETTKSALSATASSISQRLRRPKLELPRFEVPDFPELDAIMGKTAKPEPQPVDAPAYTMSGNADVLGRTPPKTDDESGKHNLESRIKAARDALDRLDIVTKRLEKRPIPSPAQKGTQDDKITPSQTSEAGTDVRAEETSASSFSAPSRKDIKMEREARMKDLALKRIAIAKSLLSQAEAAAKSKAAS
jgi:hypothetical protein